MNKEMNPNQQRGDYMHLVKELRSYYFLLLKKAMHCHYKPEEIIPDMLESVKTVLHASYAAGYVFDDLTSSYRLIACRPKEKNYLYKDYLGSADENGVCDTFEKELKDGNMLSLSISFEEGCPMVLLFTFEQKRLPRESAVQIVMQETQQLGALLMKNREQTTNRNYYEQLFDASKRLLRNNDRNVISQEIVHIFEKYFPGYKYFILLSYDNDVQPGLPVKTIDFNDDMLTEECRSAFLTGKMQTNNKEQEKKTYIYAPIAGKQGIYGVIEAVLPITDYLKEEKMQFMVEIANLAGSAIENASLYKTSELQSSALAVVNNISHRINANLNVSEITCLVKDEINKYSGAKEIGFIYNGETGADYSMIDGSTAFFGTPKGNQLILEVLQETKAKDNSIFNGDLLVNHPFSTYRSMIAVPMKFSSNNLVLVILLHEKRYHFDFETFKLIEAIVQHATLAIANTMLKERLQIAAVTDHLTGMYTRRYLEDQLHGYLESDKHGVFILFDVDNFKEVNDYFGHEAGDQVLNQVAGIMKKIVGDDEIAARWGGEEFAIHLLNRKLEDIGDFIAAVLKETEENTNPHVTLSAGASEWNQDMTVTAKQLLIIADRRLYQAKNSGKNRAVLN